MKVRTIAVALMLFAASACGGSGSTGDTDWELLGNSPEMQHHSGLEQINRDTIGKLELAWWVEMPTQDGLVGNPLVKDGRIFQGGPDGQIFANDLKTGRLLWSYSDDKTGRDDLSLVGYWGRRMNRGAALSGGNVIIGTGDCRLIAVDQVSGKKAWEATSCDARGNYAITAAPRVGEGLIFTGNSCMDSGSTRGFVEAFDAKTGARRWRFYTVPGDPSKPQDSPLYEMAAKTWGKDWHDRTRGCGSAWDAITYDPELHLLYIGVGGPAPFNPSMRGTGAGDELFTNSIVALDARTGEYRWHFKQVPHDAWNYDASVGIMIADLPVEGEQRRVVISVPKGGFAYVIDAKSGKFLSGQQYVPITWATGLTADGRPIINPEGQYWLRRGQENIVLPSGLGAHGWEALAHDPVSKLVYIPVMSMPNLVKDAPDAILGGQTFEAYHDASADAKYQTYGEIVAWDPVKNSVAWRQRHPYPMNGGLLHTAGGLVFQGMAQGEIQAFDAAAGKLLWTRKIGGAVRAAPSTVMLDGEQYIIMATGNGAAAATGNMVADSNSSLEARTPPRLLAFKIGGSSAYPPFAKVEPIAAPAAPRQNAALAARGARLFEFVGCVECHGIYGNAAGGRIPNLIRTPPADFATFKAIVQEGALSRDGGGMPRFDIPEADARAIFAYLVNQAWDAHEGRAPVVIPEPAKTGGK